MLAFLCVAACGIEQAAQPPSTRPDDTLTQLPSRPELPILSEAAETRRSEILAFAQAGRLRAFARLADASDGFVSNFADSSHYDHWSLLRRTGVDPLAQVILLLAEPHAEKRVGDETWYIWPDLAALSPAALVPERLDFKDRARLRDLVGEDGIETIRAGGAYPGFRMAIASNGRWVYYLHETGDEVSE